MKKLTCLIVIAATAVTSYGQGKVSLANSTATAITNSQNSAKIDKNGFKVSIYSLPWTSDSAVPTTADFDANGVVAGSTTLFANGLFNNGGAFVVAPNISPAGGMGWFQVRAWELAFGTDYSTAATRIGALVGTSNVIKVNTGDPANSTDQPGSILVGDPLTGGLKAFLVYPVVPEPTAIALGLLGLGALALLRRRN